MLGPLALWRRLWRLWPREPFAAVQTNALGITGIERDTGLLVLRNGERRAVIQLPAASFADEAQTTRTYGHLAAAVNGAPCQMALLAWGEPTGVAPALAQQQARVRRLAAEDRAHPSRRKHQQLVLATAHAFHLEELAKRQERRQAMRPRRYTFLLTLDGHDPATLMRQAEDVAASFGGRRLREAHAVAQYVAQGWRPPAARLTLPRTEVAR